VEHVVQAIEFLSIGQRKKCGKFPANIPLRLHHFIVAWQEHKAAFQGARHLKDRSVITAGVSYIQNDLHRAESLSLAVIDATALAPGTSYELFRHRTEELARLAVLAKSVCCLIGMTTVRMQDFRSDFVC
jgi:hypothetical protein